MFKTPPSKQPATNQNAGDGSHVVQGELDKTAVNNSADIRTPSGDISQTLSPTKSDQDVNIANGALASMKPYPCEVCC